jgi:hypothetical protein
VNRLSGTSGRIRNDGLGLDGRRNQPLWVRTPANLVVVIDSQEREMHATGQERSQYQQKSYSDACQDLRTSLEGLPRN